MSDGRDRDKYSIFNHHYTQLIIPAAGWASVSVNILSEKPSGTAQSIRRLEALWTLAA